MFGVFIGFAPAEDPQIVIVVTVDEPRGTYYGGTVSAPVFKKVAAEVLKYLRTKRSSQDTLVFNAPKRAD